MNSVSVEQHFMYGNAVSWNTLLHGLRFTSGSSSVLCLCRSVIHSP